MRLIRTTLVWNEEIPSIVRSPIKNIEEILFQNFMPYRRISCVMTSVSDLYHNDLTHYGPGVISFWYWHQLEISATLLSTLAPKISRFNATSLSLAYVGLNLKITCEAKPLYTKSFTFTNTFMKMEDGQGLGTSKTNPILLKTYKYN